jgi:DNA-binding XRE family transcriptional regulator
VLILSQRSGGVFPDRVDVNHPAGEESADALRYLPDSPTMPIGRKYNADADRFGTILRQLREQRGWTRQKLAQRAGLAPTYIGVLEAGGNVPTISTALELIEVLGGDIGDIMRRLAAARVAPPG